MEEDEDREHEDGDAWDEFPDSPGVDDQQQEETDSATRQECLQAFTTPDYIMEPEVFNQLKRYFKAGGNPEPVVQLLSDNYTAVAQTANLMAEWLIQAGIDIKEVQEMVERHLQDMIVKYFDPKKADSIFTVAGETPSWLYEMIEFPTWRNLFYKLAEEYPDCLMLNFTVKLISDAGYQGEITSVSTACHQIEVFSRVLRTCVSSFLELGEEAGEKNLSEFTKMVCHGEHTYLYSQLLMNILCQEPKGGSNVRRLCQEVHKSAKQRGLEVTPITMSLSGAAAYPRACQALSSMLSRNALNPADITVLYKMYTSADPPPVEMIRSPQFLDLFIDALFKPGVKLNPEHKPKYLYIVSYASSVAEIWKKGVRKSINRDELKTTMQALEKTHNLCSDDKGYTELLADVGTLFQCVKIQVVAKGVLRWIHHTVSDPSYFRLNTDHTPLHLVLLDEISTNHILLHKEILSLLIQMFEQPFEELDVLVRLNLKKVLLDRMVHLLSCGCILPVISYIRSCWLKGDTDISLIRYFATEVLDVIAPPYTSEFVQLFFPLIDSEDITGSLRTPGENDPVSEFIRHCKANHGL
jgi:negative elongation factor C/D